MADELSDLQTAEKYAAAYILMGLQTLERGWETLELWEPLVTQGLDVAKSEAVSRGVAEDDITTTPQTLLSLTQELGASGVDPHDVAAETKSEKAASAEAELSNKDPAERAEAGETLPAQPGAAPTQVAPNASTPAPPGAVVAETVPTPEAAAAGTPVHNPAETETAPAAVPVGVETQSPTGTGQPPANPTELPPHPPGA